MSLDFSMTGVQRTARASKDKFTAAQLEHEVEANVEVGNEVVRPRVQAGGSNQASSCRDGFERREQKWTRDRRSTLTPR